MPTSDMLPFLVDTDTKNNGVFSAHMCYPSCWIGWLCTKQVIQLKTIHSIKYSSWRLPPLLSSSRTSNSSWAVACALTCPSIVPSGMWTGRRVGYSIFRCRSLSIIEWIVVLPWIASCMSDNRHKHSSQLDCTLVPEQTINITGYSWFKASVDTSSVGRQGRGEEEELGGGGAMLCGLFLQRGIAKLSVLIKKLCFQKGWRQFFAENNS